MGTGSGSVATSAGPDGAAGARLPVHSSGGAPRYLLAAFPLFIGLGLLTRWRWVFGLWLVLSAAMSLVLCGLFVTWWYVA